MRTGRRALAAAFLAAVAACGRKAEPAPAPPTRAQVAAPGPCLILTSPEAADALVVNGGAQVQAPRCELHVASRAMFFAATLNADSRLDVDELCVAGDIARKGGLVSNPLRGCSAAIDPWRGRPPAPPPPPDAPCDARPRAVNGGRVRLEPGVWCGGLAFDGAPQVEFAPGLYVIRGGDWTFNGGDYAGDGVSLYFADASRPVFNSGVSLALSAPASGPRAGVLMDEAPGLPRTTLAFNDARRFELDGLVHLPSRAAVWNSGSQLQSTGLLAVFDSAVLNQTRWTIARPWRKP